MMQGWYYVESLTGQWHDRVQTESQIATVDSCFDLVASVSDEARQTYFFFKELNRATELAKHTWQIADLTAETMQTNISALTDLDVHDQFANAPLSQLRPPPFWSWGRVGDLKENSKYTNV